MIKLTDGEGKVAEFTYDLFNRLVSVIDSQNQVTRYSYDAKGNLIEVMTCPPKTGSFSMRVLML